MLRKDNELYEFNGFRLDVAEHRLTRIDDVPVPAIPEKAFQTLVHLIRHKGSLVTKKELLETVWPDAIVEENNLDKAIHTLRQALGEKNGDQKYIETVRKHGYRFLAPVRTVFTRSHLIRSVGNGSLEPNAIPILAKPQITASGQHVMFDIAIDEIGTLEPQTIPLVGVSVDVPNGDSPPGDVPADTASVETSKKKRRYSSKVLAIGLAALITAGVIAYFGFVRASSGDPAPISIAILPALPLDTTERNGLYEYGIADALINRLSSVNGYVVRPLSATRGYNKLDQDPLAAGRELKTGYVLASNYQVADGRIKVSSQVYDVASGKVVETYRVEHAAASVFGAQDAIANDISHNILARFGADKVDFQAKRGTDNEEAYTLYLMATNLSEERGVQNVMKSLGYLDRAVALDPNYARAWAAKAHRHRDVVGHTDAGQHENYQRSIEAIGKALAIDPNLSEAYSALCHNKSRYEFDFIGAEAACKRAMELDPTSPVAYKVYANFLYSHGRFDEAIGAIKRAIEIQPVSYENQQIYALTLYFARRYAESEEQFRRLIELNPTHSFIHGRLVLVLQEQGKDSEALDHYLKLLSMQEKDRAVVERVRSAFQVAGWRGVLEERIKIAEAEPNPRYFQLACMYSKIGNKDRALDYLEKMFQERRFQVVMIEVEPQLDSLRDDPRYKDLARRIRPV